MMFIPIVVSPTGRPIKKHVTIDRVPKLTVTVAEYANEATNRFDLWIKHQVAHHRIKIAGRRFFQLISKQNAIYCTATLILPRFEFNLAECVKGYLVPNPQCFGNAWLSSSARDLDDFRV